MRRMVMWKILLSTRMGITRNKWYNGVMVKKKDGRKKRVGQTGVRRVVKIGKVKRSSYADYLDGRIKLKLYQRIGILLLVVVFAGFFGWVWEFMLQEVSGGFRHLYIKGGNLLPWINIYAYGALLIIPTTYWLRRYPWAVFLMSAVVCGLLEWFAGWVVYTVGNGTRYWNYEGRWWGIGNIDGFVCPASAFAFGVGALLLVYWLLPFCIRVSVRMSRRAFLTLAIWLFAAVMVDDITNLTLKNLDLPTAMNLYESWGWKYLAK